MKRQIAEELEVRMVGVVAEFVKLYQWLDRIKANLRTNWETAERLRRAGSVVKEEPEVLATRYCRGRRAEEALKAVIGTTAEKLRDLWACGLTKVNGVAISPSVELQLPQEALVAALAPEVAAQVLRRELVLDVGALLDLADRDPQLQALIERHLSAKCNIEIKRVGKSGTGQ